MKYITDKNGFEFTKEEVEETAYTLKNAIDGDVISAHFRKKKSNTAAVFLFFMSAEKNLSGKKTGENQSKAKHYCS